MKSLHWRGDIWFDCVERKRRAKLPASATAPRAFAAVLSFQACVHMHILYMCVYICVRVYVCGHVCMYIYAYVYVFVHVCVYTHVYVYVYAYLCTDCGSCYQCFSVWTVSCMRMCVRVHMYSYGYVCRCIYMCTFLEIIIDLPIGFPINNIISLSVHFFALSVTCTLNRCFGH